MPDWFLPTLVAAIAVVVLIRLVRFRMRAIRQRPPPDDSRRLLEGIDTVPDAPIAFGYKTSWLAIRSSMAEPVLDALCMNNVQRANWKSGYIAAYKDRTFVSPVLEGWVFVVGHVPALDAGDANLCWANWMESLAARFSDVQYFGTHRVVGYHAWARYLHGHQQRAFAYLGESGEILVNCGQPTEGELQLGHKFFDASSPEAESDEYWERDDLSFPTEDCVMQVAGKWSIDPQTLKDRQHPTEAGWIGTLRQLPQ